jgi:uncharacterized protein (TIGR04255 family)
LFSATPRRLPEFGPKPQTKQLRDPALGKQGWGSTEAGIILLINLMPARHYPNAPITEALVDIRVNYAQGTTLEKLKKFGAEVRSQYPHENTRDVVQGKIDLSGPNPQSQSSRATVGYIFHSADRRQAVQVRMDGFTFSRFAPYQSWDHLIDETKRLWGVFVTELEPTTVLRVAVRYINQINLPLGSGQLSFENYFSTLPRIDTDQDVPLEQFFLRLVMPQNDLHAQLILTEALLPQQGASLGVILDIDLFRENLELSVRSGEIWDILDKFRERKNKYFELSITDAARELFA